MTIIMDNDPAYGGLTAKKPSIRNCPGVEELWDEKEGNMFAEVGAIYGIATSFTNKETSTQSGVCERKIRTVRGLLRTILFDSGIRTSAWDVVVKFGLGLLINLWISKDETKTPWELWYGYKPPVEKLKPIGCRVHVYEPEDKVGEQNYPAIFIGYDKANKGCSYEMTVRWWYMTDNGEIFHSKNLVFQEGVKPLRSNMYAREHLLGQDESEFPPTIEVSESKEKRVKKQTEFFDPKENSERPQWGDAKVYKVPLRSGVGAERGLPSLEEGLLESVGKNSSVTLPSGRLLTSKK
jgi:hypothetical protein